MKKTKITMLTAALLTSAVALNASERDEMEAFIRENSILEVPVYGPPVAVVFTEQQDSLLDKLIDKLKSEKNVTVQD